VQNSNSRLSTGFVKTASSTAPSPVAPTPAAKPANRRLTLNNGQSLVLLGDIFTSPPTDTDTDTPTARLPIKDALAKQTRNIRFSPTAILFLSDEVFTYVHLPCVVMA
jgi:hypothetical protein